MAVAEIVQINGRSFDLRCKKCGAGMSCGLMLPGRRTHRCSRCDATLFVYHIEMGDCSFELDVWPHECPEGMPLGTYVSGLIAQLGASAG